MNVPLADLRVDHEGMLVVAAIEGEIDMSNATELRQAIVRAIFSDALGLVLDLSGVTYLDSTGVHIVFDLRDRLAERGQELCLALPSASPAAETLRVADVLGSVGVAETRASALAELSAADSRRP